jgi:hypothetical protein
MSKLHISLKIRASLVVFLLDSILVGVAMPQPTGSQKRMTTKELKSLIQNAKTAEDHWRIAAYYQSKAAHLLKESKEDQGLTEAYANRTLYARRLQFAAYEAEAAKEAQDMAAIHEAPAKKASWHEDGKP